MFEQRQRQKRNNHMSISSGKGFAIVINKVKVSGNYINTIYDMIQGHSLIKYWIQQDRFPVSETSNIDWDVIKLARARLPFDRKIWMTTQVSGFCGTGVKMKLWNFRDFDVCSLCTKPEDKLHVITCVSTSANAVWDTSLDTLEQILLNNHTSQITVSMIIDQL